MGVHWFVPKGSRCADLRRLVHKESERITDVIRSAEHYRVSNWAQLRPQAMPSPTMDAMSLVSASKAVR